MKKRNAGKDTLDKLNVKRKMPVQANLTEAPTNIWSPMKWSVHRDDSWTGSGFWIKPTNPESFFSRFTKGRQDFHKRRSFGSTLQMSLQMIIVQIRSMRKGFRDIHFAPERILMSENMDNSIKLFIEIHRKKSESIEETNVLWYNRRQRYSAR